MRYYLHMIAAMAVGLLSTGALAHCDTLDGPVVGAARKALDTNNVNLVLLWVQKKDEAEIRKAFQKTVAVRKAGGDARELADHYFFETLVRIHRLGEGATYTGLKSERIEPIVAAADNSIATGNVDGVAQLVSERMHKGLERQFQNVKSKSKYGQNDVAAGRAYASAYVEYVHYVERLYDAAQTLAPAGVEEKKAAHVH